MPDVSSISSTPLVEPLSPMRQAPDVADSPNFTQLLRSAIRRTEDSAAEAARLTERFMAGESVELHTVAIAGQKASLQFEMLLQVRNKVVQAYQEVMRLQL